MDFWHFRGCVMHSAAACITWPVSILKFLNSELPQFFAGSPKILKPVLDTPSQGLYVEKNLDHIPDLGSQRWGEGGCGQITL